MVSLVLLVSRSMPISRGRNLGVGSSGLMPLTGSMILGSISLPDSIVFSEQCKVLVTLEESMILQVNPPPQCNRHVVNSAVRDNL